MSPKERRIMFYFDDSEQCLKAYKALKSSYPEIKKTSPYTLSIVKKSTCHDMILSSKIEQYGGKPE